jgi:hypothetical protein
MASRTSQKGHSNREAGRFWNGDYGNELFDGDLLELRFVPGAWVVRAGNLFYGETLDHALHLAKQLHDGGTEVKSIIRMPHDEIVIGSRQIARLWKAIGMA